MRRLGIFYDLAFAMARGIVADQVFLGGFRAIDGEEWREWMSGNGASKPENLQSAVVRGCYDYGVHPGDRGIGRGHGDAADLRFVAVLQGLGPACAHRADGRQHHRSVLRVPESADVKFEFFCRVKALEMSADMPSRSRGPGATSAGAERCLRRNTSLLIKRRTAARHGPRPSIRTRSLTAACLKGVDLESAWSPWEDAIPERVLRRRHPEGEAGGNDRFRHRHSRSSDSTG